MRHAVPVAVPDPFLYVEQDGRRHAVVTAFEVPRIAAADAEIETIAPETLGIDELLADGMSAPAALLEVYARACARLGVAEAAVPPDFPL